MIRFRFKILVNCLVSVSLFGGNVDVESRAKLTPLFERVLLKISHVRFINSIVENEQHNFTNYNYIYNGGGVGVGDINNDGLTDLYFSANQESNTLYLNQGKFCFKDISTTAGVNAQDGWKNGVTFIDINCDGLLDIYVCQSGTYSDPEKRANRLYINNGNLTFKESASDFGLNDKGYSIQSYFFDYDRDNDLDMFLVNHRIDFNNNNTVIPKSDQKLSVYESDKLYRNNGDNTFTDITYKAGIANSAWGLSAVTADFNNDGWEDIYVANDYIEPDYLYLNNKDGTFTDNITAVMKHISYYSMGSDFADINNDSLPDLIVLDMAPDDRARSKKMMATMSSENFSKLIEGGYVPQYMINTLQINNGNGTYGEIAQFAGISKTDWSWSALFADFDNDGLQDLFVSNGIKRDITDNDFFLNIEQIRKKGLQITFDQLYDLLPSTTIKNHIYRNTGHLKFEKVNELWGMTDSVNSNGAAYADLDNDGDLELIVNNIDTHASIYKNMSRENTDNNYIKIQLNGPVHNPNGIGAEIKLRSGDLKLYHKALNNRGYLSSVNTKTHFGLGKNKIIDHITVIWPDRKKSILKHVNTNQVITVNYQSYVNGNDDLTSENPGRIRMFTDTSNELEIKIHHIENRHNDFAKESLLPHKQSEHGPLLATGDINNDGLDDFFIGGSSGYSGTMYIQTQSMQFEEYSSQPWSADSQSEDLGSLLFDADNDGDLDLYVVSGGNEFETDAAGLQDRLYVNQSGKSFTKSADALPKMITSGLRVISGDYDNDGDPDLFIGGRISPGNYPRPPRSYLLKNTDGKFSDVTQTVAPALLHPGMITDALFVDIDNDEDLDLILCGEWLTISIFKNSGRDFTDVTAKAGLSQTNGWWFCLGKGDFNNDGYIDLVAGNVGENNKYKPSANEPLRLYANDFDNNGSLDIVLANSDQKTIYPVRGRDCSSLQMPFIKSNFPTYSSFANANIEQIYTKELLNSAINLEVSNFSSCILLNNGSGQFKILALPIEIQLSSINSIISKDLNSDGILDLITAGNMYGTEPETARYDAGIGMILVGQGDGSFKALNLSKSGFYVPGNVKDLKLIKSDNNRVGLLVANNNDRLQAFIMNDAKVTENGDLTFQQN